MSRPPANATTYGISTDTVNNQQVDNRNTPSYLSHYGMFRAPFLTNAIEDDMYYAEPTRTQRLDILLHLAQYGNELLLVTGPEGSGKTTMLHQFMKKIGEDWKVCQINAHNMLSEEQLLSRISRGFDLPDESGNIASAKTNLKRRLDAMLTTSQTVVIAVDNAQILSTGALNLLLELATIRNVSKGIAVRILLFSEPQIKIQLASPELQSRQTLPIRKIDLPPFDEQQTARLIRHRVTTAGLVSKHVFNDAIISKIYKYSQGWPGLITEIAHQVLFESTPLKRRDSASRPAHSDAAVNSFYRPVPIIIAVLVVTGLAAVLLFQDQINSLFKSDHGTVAQSAGPQSAQSLTSSDEPTTAGTHPGSTTSSMTVSSLTENKKTEEQEFPIVSDQGASAADQHNAAADSASGQPTPSTSADHPIPTESTPASEQPAQSNISAAPSDSESQTTQNSESTAMASTSDLPRHDAVPLQRQENWIMSQNPDHFTLQLVAGYQQSTVINFISRHELADSDLAYYYSLNRGKGWHSLIFGSYANRDQARGAAKELSKQVNHLKPWIRSFKSIQGDIQYARKHSR